MKVALYLALQVALGSMPTEGHPHEEKAAKYGDFSPPSLLAHFQTSPPQRVVRGRSGNQTVTRNPRSKKESCGWQGRNKWV